MRHESFAAVRKDAMVDEELASTEAAKCRWHAKRGQAMQNSNSTLSLAFTPLFLVRPRFGWLFAVPRLEIVIFKSGRK